VGFFGGGNTRNCIGVFNVIISTISALTLPPFHDVLHKARLVRKLSRLSPQLLTCNALFCHYSNAAERPVQQLVEHRTMCAPSYVTLLHKQLDVTFLKRNSCLIPWSTMWDFWWEERQSGRLSSSTLVFPCQSSFLDWSILISYRSKACDW